VTKNERKQLIKKSLTILWGERSAAELRVPRSDAGALTGIFDDVGKMAQAAADESGVAPGVYFGLNPIRDSAAARVQNRLKRSAAIKDEDIERRLWLLIDFDPIRTANTPSTEAEHEAALKRARQCRRFLTDLGWPEPVFVDTGNGANLLYGIDGPNDDQSRELIKGCLEMLAMKFDTAEVRVDIGNFNASRVSRVPGTKNCKGIPTDDRPHRFAKLLRAPEEINVVSTSLLTRLASGLARAVAVRNGFDVAEWIKKVALPVIKEGPWKGTGYRWELQCPWDKGHTNNSAYIVQFPDRGVAAGCLHESCSGRDWPDLRKLYEPADGEVETESDEKNLARSKRANQTDELLDFASRDANVFCTPQGETYASVRIENHFENYALASREMKLWLRLQYFRKTRTAPKAQAIQEALSQLDAVARYERAKEPIFLRVASNKSTSYLDLGDELWRAVEIDGDGWRVTENPSVKFRRPDGMLGLPEPIRGGDIEELKRFLNLRSDDDWILFLENLLNSLLVRTCYPVPAFCGEAGSGKTTQSRIPGALIDPNRSPARAMPKDIRDLMIFANNSWVLVFDNLSYLPPWFSDCLCRLSTGGGFATRQLFTDVGEVVLDYRRPVILNGIEELASRTDLLDRTIIFDLPVIERFRSEEEFWAEFELARPRILGALLDIAVQAIKQLPKAQLQNPPRLADFALLATAAESAIGLAKGSFMKAYAENRKNANAVALEASPIAGPICDLVEKGPWQGTAAILLTKLTRASVDQEGDRRGWPKTAKTLSGMLRRLATALRKTGIEVKFWREEGKRMISISKTRNRANKKENA
jgi:hypothetical protein